jgi:periplasmic divalent cation tolerance protein
MLISDEYLQIVTTAGSADEARRIAAALVEERLAACVQIVGPIESIYRWEGKVETAIRRLHSYEVPEMVAMPIVAGSEAYLKWLSKETE